ncbi:BadF-type ATPase [Micromonospora pallida]|uniref:BadF-type ATPase n=1 Tax=Micromonospora pallida TaxID=145854 RepID=A0A1C6S9C1_9ACTN|nr:BadF/BadG/BcrA/BcrD ATPase family protein [Micromonospora pallida]SCL25931.1 BadF-type ATPase [Micromonospora pallida]
MTNTITIDGGKSQLRMLLRTPAGRQLGVGPGFSYRPHEDGVERIMAAVRDAAATISRPERVAGVVAGLTGVPGENAERRRLARALTGLLGGPAVVVEDSLLAHAGALGGAGVVLCVGTGTTVLAVAADGTHARLDGWGPHLGDRGSAYAIGLAGMRAATAAHDRVGPETVLVDRLVAALGGSDLAALQRYYRDPELVPRTASFARDVLDAADRADPVASRICAGAATDLADAAQAATARLHLDGTERRVSYSGRLLAPGNVLHRALSAELAARGLPLVAPRAEPLDGGPTLLDGTGPYARLLAHQDPGGAA